MDGRTSVVSRAAALNASRPIIERDVAPFFRREPKAFQLCVRITYRRFAMGADHSHQPLRQYAVQSGDKVIRFHTHVQKATEYIDYVIGVDRGENKVSG